MSTDTITRVLSTAALTVMGTGLALAAVTAPANAADARAQGACTAQGGTYQELDGSPGQIVTWTCTYPSAHSGGLPATGLEIACSGTYSYGSGSGGVVFTCSPVSGLP
jgi:hypothetical protein